MLSKLKSMFGKMLAVDHRQRSLGRDVSGLDADALADAIEGAIGPESRAIFNEVLEHVDGWPDGCFMHGIDLWLITLMRGQSRLPERIPHDVVRVWRSGKYGCPPLCRCERCHFSFARYFTSCPSCGAGEEDLRMQNLAAALGEYEDVHARGGFAGHGLAQLEEWLHQDGRHSEYPRAYYAARGTVETAQTPEPTISVRVRGDEGA